MTPLAPPRPCAQSGCPELVRGASRCPAHTIQRDKRYATRMYRDRIIASSSCVDCGQPAEELDHVVALVNGGAESSANKVPRCHACHVAKTQRDLGRRG